MAYQDLNTLKNWFKKGLKPLAQHFADWMDSFWHKGEQIPSNKIDGLQTLLDHKVTDAPADDQEYIRKNNDWQLAGQVPKNTDIIIPVDTVGESLSEIAPNQQEINIENKTAILTLRDAVRRLAGAAVTINIDATPQVIGTSETDFDFVTTFQSTNEDVITTDDTANEITLKLDGRYQFGTYIVFNNPSNSTDALITLRTRFTDNNIVNTERQITVPKNSIYIAPITNVPFDLSGAPRSIKITFQSDISNVEVIQFETTLTTSAGTVSNGGGAGLPDTWYTNNAEVRAITDYADGYDVGVYASGAIYEFSAVLTNADDDDTYLKPDDIAVGDPGRWVKRKVFELLRTNVTASTVAVNGQTTAVDFNVINSNKVPFQDGVTTHTLAFQNMSTTEKNPAIVIDNTANNSGLVVTFNDQSGAVKFNEADGDFPGIFPQMNVAANQKYRIEFYSISATEIDIEFVPQNTLN